MQSWNAELYLRFGSERTQPVLDLAARITVPAPRRIIDLGCGPGNSTAVLARRWPRALVVGLDNSKEMIAAAAASYPEGNWVLGDLSEWTAKEPFEVIFSNAALQWAPDHASLFPRLLSRVAPGGALAVQMPAIYASPLHGNVMEVADDPQWKERMEQAKSATTRNPPSFYYDLLQPLASRLELWETEYYHFLDSSDAVIEWFRATGLRPYLSALTIEERGRFERLLREKCESSYRRQKDGRILFPFKRIFIIAHMG